ncbi:MAG: SOS response-associated peptidase [Nitrospirales bacterium]|nr:SOS response-associated peptidase [Nitrospirales bacterium]
MLQVAHMPTLKPRYNIAPNQMVACARHSSENGSRECVMLRWGLVPSWAKDVRTGSKMINARCETITEKPSFRNAFRTRRCLVLADGFYEWKREGKAKQPYYICFKDHRPFAFAGLWERWQQFEDRIDSCAIITTGSNTLMEAIHPRMPVILNPRDFNTWLDPAVHEPASLSPLLSSCSSDEMKAYPVSTLVNNPRQDCEECMAEVA